MSDSFLSNIVETLGKASFGIFTTVLIPNQEMPAENFLITRFGYGKAGVLNNAVRMAEVNDGVLFKLPMIKAVKLPHKMIRGLSVTEENQMLSIQLSLTEEGLGVINLYFPAKYRSQIPYLLNLVGQSESNSHSIDGMEESNMPDMPNLQEENMPTDFDESKEDLWSIPKSKTSIPQSPPINLESMDFGGWLRAGVLIFMIVVLLNYFLS